MANDAQREQWNNENFAKMWPRRERLTTAVTAPLLERAALRGGERVLDVGAGGGLAAIAAAKAVAPDGSVTGFDLSEPLVALATERAAEGGLRNLRFIAGDAQTDDIAGAPFDVAISQFGVMFFADPVAAFRNIRRHLTPGGRCVFACWQPISENHWYPAEILAAYASPPAPSQSDVPPPGPFALGDVSYATGILKGAGFSDVRCDRITVEVAVPADSLYDEQSVSAMRLEPKQHAEAWAALQAEAKARTGADGQLRVRLSPQIFSATNA